MERQDREARAGQAPPQQPAPTDPKQTRTARIRDLETKVRELKKLDLAAKRAGEYDKRPDLAAQIDKAVRELEREKEAPLG